MGVVAFALQVNEYSGPVENLDGTWSIVYLIRKINKQYIPFDGLYNKIESIVMKETQSNFKKNLFEVLYKDLNVTINPEFYVFGDSLGF